MIGKIVGFVFLLATAFFILFDPKYDQLDSMYNDLHCNITMAQSGIPIDGNHEFTWNEFYSEELFEQALKESEYDGSWSVAYGFDPGVLQFNGIRTLDGYYSNYSLDYHDAFQRIIQPELDMDERHALYWKESSGARAYCYSPYWDFAARKNDCFESVDMYIDTNAFRELGGKYVFSRYLITNSDDLQLDLVGSWSNSKSSPYSIYLYQLRQII